MEKTLLHVLTEQMMNLGKYSAWSLYLFLLISLLALKKIFFSFDAYHRWKQRRKMTYGKEYDFIIGEGIMFRDGKHAVIFYSESNFFQT